MASRSAPIGCHVKRVWFDHMLAIAADDRSSVYRKIRTKKGAAFPSLVMTTHYTDFALLKSLMSVPSISGEGGPFSDPSRPFPISTSPFYCSLFLPLSVFLSSSPFLYPSLFLSSLSHFLSLCFIQSSALFTFSTFYFDFLVFSTSI